MKRWGRWMLALGSATALAWTLQMDQGAVRLWAAGAPAAGGAPVPTPGDAEAAGKIGLRTIGGHSILVWIAEDEFARLQRRA